jgi:hypothetical protein
MACSSFFLSLHDARPSIKCFLQRPSRRFLASIALELQAWSFLPVSSTRDQLHYLLIVQLPNHRRQQILPSCTMTPHSFMTAHIFIPSPCDDASNPCGPRNPGRDNSLAYRPCCRHRRHHACQLGSLRQHFWLPGAWMLAKRRPVSLGPCHGPQISCKALARRHPFSDVGAVAYRIQSAASCGLSRETWSPAGEGRDLGSIKPPRCRVGRKGVKFHV